MRSDVLPRVTSRLRGWLRFLSFVIIIQPNEARWIAYLKFWMIFFSTWDDIQSFSCFALRLVTLKSDAECLGKWRFSVAFARPAKWVELTKGKMLFSLLENKSMGVLAYYYRHGIPVSYALETAVWRSTTFWSNANQVAEAGTRSTSEKLWGSPTLKSCVWGAHSIRNFSYREPFV